MSILKPNTGVILFSDPNPGVPPVEVPAYKEPFEHGHARNDAWLASLVRATIRSVLEDALRDDHVAFLKRHDAGNEHDASQLYWAKSYRVAHRLFNDTFDDKVLVRASRSGDLVKTEQHLVMVLARTLFVEVYRRCVLPALEQVYAEIGGREDELEAAGVSMEEPNDCPGYRPSSSVRVAETHIHTASGAWYTKYWLSSNDSRTSWILWCELEGYPSEGEEYPCPVAHCPRKGIRRAKAALNLIEYFWIHRVRDDQQCEPDGVDSSRLIDGNELERIKVRVWGNADPMLATYPRKLGYDCDRCAFCGEELIGKDVHGAEQFAAAQEIRLYRSALVPVGCKNQTCKPSYICANKDGELTIHEDPVPSASEEPTVH